MARRLITADTEEFKRAVKYMEEDVSPEFTGLLKLLAQLFPEELNCTSFIDIYHLAFSLVSDIEDIEAKAATRLHLHTILFMDETFPVEFSDKTAQLLSDKYMN